MKQIIRIQQMIDGRYSAYKSYMKDELINELARQIVENNFATITEEQIDNHLTLIKLDFKFDDLT